MVSHCRGEEDDSLAIKPPQQMSRKEKAHHRKDEKRKEKRRHRSHSAEGGTEHLFHFVLCLDTVSPSYFMICYVLQSSAEREKNKILAKSINLL